MDREIRSYLRRQARDAELLFEPVHPLMLRGPQALVSQPGSLCAVFAPLAAERANTAHLAARLIDARLALPATCRMVLVLGRHDGQEQARMLRNDFNLVVASGDASLGTFLSEPDDFGSAVPLEPRIKEVARARFGIALTTSRRVFREARVRTRRADPSKLDDRVRRVPVSASANSRGHTYDYQPRNRFDVPNGTMSILGSKHRSGLTRQLRNAVDAHLLESWTLDTGVPYPVPTSAAHVAAASHGMELLEPREDMLTAAAFAGVAVSPTTDDDVVEYALRTARAAASESGQVEVARLL